MLHRGVEGACIIIFDDGSVFGKQGEPRQGRNGQPGDQDSRVGQLDHESVGRRDGLLTLPSPIEHHRPDALYEKRESHHDPPDLLRLPLLSKAAAFSGIGSRQQLVGPARSQHLGYLAAEDPQGSLRMFALVRQPSQPPVQPIPDDGDDGETVVDNKDQGRDEEESQPDPQDLFVADAEEVTKGCDGGEVGY